MIDINCDVGEGLDNEHLLMPYLTSCNIACGGHAGDHETMSRVVGLAKEKNVKIGAHPSYPDRENFGRKSIKMAREELSVTILSQIQALEKIVDQHGAKIHHIKPHGALYNDLAKSQSLVEEFLDIITPYKNQYKLYVPYGSVISHETLRRGFDIVYEAFADRNYNDDLSLVSRTKNNALLTDPEMIVKHISKMLNDGQVETVSGKLISIKASTFCVHSDTSSAIDIVKKINQKLK